MFMEVSATGPLPLTSVVYGERETFQLEQRSPESRKNRQGAMLPFATSSQHSCLPAVFKRWLALEKLKVLHIVQ